MDYTPHGHRPGNAFAVAQAQYSDVHRGSVKAARERLRAAEFEQALDSRMGVLPSPSRSQNLQPLQHAQTQYYPANRLEQRWRAPRMPQIPPASPVPPIPSQRTYQQAYEQADANDELQWPLPATRFVPDAPLHAPRPLKTRKALGNPISPPPPPPLPPSFYSQREDYSPHDFISSRPSFTKQRDRPSLAPSPALRYGHQDQNQAMSHSTPIGTNQPMPAAHVLPLATRRSQNPKPPPSQRRGPSAHYSQHSYIVSPIREESVSSRDTAKSFASSGVIPGQMPNSFFDEAQSDEDDGSAVEFDHRYDGDRMEESQLVWKADVGKRGKPSITTIGGADHLQPGSGNRYYEHAGHLQTGSDHRFQGHAANTSDFAAGAHKSYPNSGFFDDSPSELSLPREMERASAAGTENAEALDLQSVKLREISELYQTKAAEEHPDEGGLSVKGSTVERGSVAELRLSRLRFPSFEQNGKKRPPSLNLNAVRDAKARGSLTSLPDLIRRADQLASNLERGRTASRLGLDWMVSNNEKQGHSKGPHNAGRDSTRSTLSGLLASFPLYGTPPQNQYSHGRNVSEWPGLDPAEWQGHQQRSAMDYVTKTPKRRECCGLTSGRFLVAMTTVVLLLTVAILLPIVIIVLPQRSKTS